MIKCPCGREHRIFLLLFSVLLYGCSNSLVHPDKFGVPYESKELISYSTSWGSGKVMCITTQYGRVYECTIVRPCRPDGNNACGCAEDICQEEEPNGK